MTRLNDAKLKQLENSLIEIAGNQLTVGEAVRWMLLIDALDIIGQEYEEQGLTFDTDIITKKAKPHKAIVRYIEERYVAFLHGMYV